MNCKKLGAVSFLLSAAFISAAPAEHPAEPTAVPSCGLPLPPVQMTNVPKGPVSGPFILPGQRTGNDAVTLLSMNTQNIPFAKWQNPNYRKDRKDCLTQLADRFDAAAFQEDFLTRRHMPANAWKPVFERSYLLKSSRPGLSFQSRLDFDRVDARPYTASLCSGWTDKSNDCLATKGYMVVRLRGVTIVNTHMDAGRNRTDHAARAAQMAELSNAIPDNGPVMVVGDSNLNIHSPADQHVLDMFMARHNLILVKRYSDEKGLDIVLSRDVDINWVGVVNDPLLSDHAGLAVNFQTAQSPFHPVP